MYFTLSPVRLRPGQHEKIHCWQLENHRGTVLAVIWGRANHDRLQEAMLWIDWAQGWPEPIQNRAICKNLMAAGVEISRFSL